MGHEGGVEAQECAPSDCEVAKVRDARTQSCCDRKCAVTFSVTSRLNNNNSKNSRGTRVKLGDWGAAEGPEGEIHKE